MTLWYAPSLLAMPHPLWAIAFALAGSLILGTLGLIAGIWADKFDQLAAFQNFLIMPLTFLSGVFYSIHSLPPFWQAASQMNPFFYMIDGFRYGFFGLSDASPWLSLAVVGTFALAYEELLESVLEITDQVVLFTIPDLRDVPLARAIPGIVRDPVTGLPVIITVIEPVLDPVTGQPVIDPVTGDTLLAQRPSTVPLLGPAGPLAATDLVLLSAQPLLTEGVGVPVSVGGTGQALPDSLVLDAAEQGEIGAAIVGYNQVIASLAAEHDLALVDVDALVERLATGGIVSDGVLLTGEYAGQAFSLDGATFTPKGYGVIANLVIDALNLRYGGSVPHLRTDVLPGTPLLAFPSPSAP